jgi:predicted ATPase
LNRLHAGLFLMDEPESALSPQRQLALLVRMTQLVAAETAQFIVATHSPILLTYPKADIVSFDDGRLRRIALEDTAHYQITRGILESPDLYWRELLKE